MSIKDSFKPLPRLRIAHGNLPRVESAARLAERLEGKSKRPVTDAAYVYGITKGAVSRYRWIMRNTYPARRIAS